MPLNIAIVPGILGTNLYLQRPNGERVYAWYNPTRSLTHGPWDLQLAPDGVSAGPQAGGKLFTGGPVYLGTYDALINTLTSQGHRVTFAGYDWRKSLKNCAAEVAAHLAAVFPTETYHVVAHSMGGLVARLAYPLLWGNPVLGRWKRTVFIGCPHGGSHSATAQLAGLSLSWMLGASYAQLYRWAASPIPFAADVTIAFVQASKAVAATWPGLAALMPQTEAPWTALDPSADFCYDAQRYLADNPAVTQALLDGARADHAALDAALLKSRPEEISILATGNPTPDTFLPPFHFADGGSYSMTDEGDGAVTFARGHMPDRPRVTIAGGHQDYFASGTVLRTITTWEQAPFVDIPDKLGLPRENPGLLDFDVTPNTAPLPEQPWKDLQRAGDP